MKINFKDAKPERIYQVGNVIRNGDDFYLIAKDFDGGYSIVSLKHNQVIGRYDTLEELAEDIKEDDDILVHAEINVF